MTDRALWQRAQQVFAAWLDAPPGERERVLEQLCGDEGALWAEVNVLRRGHEGAAADFLEPPDGGAATPGVGAFVGGCRLAVLLGEGGMGTVWRARDESLGREVAVKVLHGGVLGRAGLQRFAQEAAALARLQHPSIATIFASGRLGPGPLAPPFFVLELVDGAMPIDAWVQQQRLPRRRRVELLAQVTDAVQHAHERAVVHRDLKPANVLVGRDAVPKIIDFGIARLVDGSDAHTTRLGQVLGTPAWLSPEQCLGDPGRIDVRTDVHALGLLGCALLTGQLPYAIDDLSLPAALQRIANDPPRWPQALAPDLERDLAAVLAKAIAKDPARRYPSASAFADDLRAFLAHRPVVARPPRALGTLGLFVRRAPGLFAALTLLGVSLVAGTVVSVHFALHAAARATAAERERATAQQLADSLREILRAGNVALAGRELTMREALDAAAATIERRFATRPAIAFELRLVLGDAYRVLGRLAEAEQQLATAGQLLAAMPGDSGLPRARLAVVQAALRGLQNRAEAVAMLDAALATFTAHAGRDDELVAETLGRRGGVLVALGRLAEAQADLQAALAMLSPRGPTLPLAEAQANLGTASFELGQLAAAEQQWRAALATFDAVVSADHPHRLKTLGNLVNVLRTRAPHDAVALAREVVQRTSACFPEGHSDVAQARAQLAFALLEAGADGALVEFTAVVALRERLQGPTHQGTLSAQTDLGYAQLALGRPGEALAPLQAAWSAQADDRASAQAAATAMLLGLAKVRTGAATAGAELLRHAVLVRTRIFGADNARTHVARSALGEGLLALGRFEEAAVSLHAAEPALVKAFGEAHREVRATRERLASLRQRQGR